MATYILFWNPAISSYTEERFLDDFESGYGVGNWSVYEYQQLQPGDHFYMMRCGDGNIGIVMKGVFISEAYESLDWSPKNRPNIFYANIYQNFTINSFNDVKLLSPGVLEKEIPDFNWYGGHSGRRLSDSNAKILDAMWEKYLEENPNLIENEQAFKNQYDYPC